MPTIEFDAMRVAPVTDEEFSIAVQILSSTSAGAMQEYILAKNPLLLDRAERAARKLGNAVKSAKRVRNV